LTGFWRIKADGRGGRRYRTLSDCGGQSLGLPLAFSRVKRNGCRRRGHLPNNFINGYASNFHAGKPVPVSRAARQLLANGGTKRDIILEHGTPRRACPTSAPLRRI
jgi:hypothetical protein